jgi:predicted acyl esterase
MLFGTILAGCLTGPPGLAPLPFDPTAVVAPHAEVASVPEGVRITWKGPLSLDAPFTFTIPPGVTRVDATYARAADAVTSIALYHADTGRIRCQPDRQAAWFTPFVGTARCSGLTVLDPLPASWRTATGLRSLATGEHLELTLTTAPLDGQAGLIRVENLAMPSYAAQPTQIVKVAASADGAELHVEVTRPDAEEPVPTILVSSPYNQATRLAGLRPQNDTIANWVPRGYAVVVADVRGFGLSGGCVEVWGANEQQDQVDLVEWVARQPWSDGKVGFYGQSYVGTTPVAAASHAAPHLTTIITIAPVINAYEDWHFGGVPNGENTGSPIAYQTSDANVRINRFTNQPGPATLLEALDQSTRGLCDPTLLVRANDPRGVYDDFYRERDFKLRATNVKASVFYTQGFYDTNVKSQMIPNWFDKLEVPKKALFGDWVHQHPPRADQELLFHAWFDHWLQGRDTGIMETPTVEVRTNVDTVRAADDWPPQHTADVRFGFHLPQGQLVRDAPGSGSARYLATHLGTEEIRVRSAPLQERLYISGLADLELSATVEGTGNTYFYADLREHLPTGASRTVTFGMLNAALRNGYDRYEPAPPQRLDYRIPFLATEYVVEPGSSLEIVLRAARVTDWYDVSPTAPGHVTVHGDRTALRLPTLPEPNDVPAPGSAGPAPLAAH